MQHQILNSAKSNAKAVPSTFAFSPNSLSLGANFVIRGNAGCYVVTAAVKSGTNYANTSTYVTIASILSPPKLSYATFSSNGAKLLVGFSADTDQGSTVISSPSSIFSCHLILTFTSSTQDYCLWISQKVILVTLGSAPLYVGDKLTLVGGVVRAGCSQDISICKSYSFSSTQFVFLTAPLNPTLPSPSVSPHLSPQSAAI